MFIDKNLENQEQKKATFEFDYYFYIKMDVDLEKCNLQKEEIEKVTYISLENLKRNQYPDGDRGLYNHHPVKDKIVKYLEEKIQN